MLKNYLKVAVRNLWRHKGLSTINILGLAIGLTTCLLLVLYVVNELSYDRYNVNADRIYRINTDIKLGESELHLAVAPDPLGAAMKKDYPQVEEYTRIYASDGGKTIKKGNQYIFEENLAYVDSTFFDVFTLPVVDGTTDGALNAPNTAVITETAAKKYTGTVNATGRVLEIDGKLFTVNAVIKDVPRNSHFHFQLFLSIQNANYRWGNYLSNNFQTYLLLRKGVDYKDFQKHFDEVIIRYIMPQAKEVSHINSLAEFRKSGNDIAYTLFPLTDIHLRSDRFPELSVNGSMQYVYIFGCVALFVLLIACINFMNLSTASSLGRAREVGIRKVLGTQRKALVWQFLLESIVTVAIALVVGVLLAWAVLPLFNRLSSGSFVSEDIFNKRILLYLIFIPVVLGVLAGSYPSFFISRFNPVTVLKGDTMKGPGRSTVRSFLVVLQFVISITLIIGTIVVFGQLNYIKTKNLGYNKDQVLIINNTGTLGNSADVFKNRVSQLRGVSNSSFASFLPVASSSRGDNSFFTSPLMDSHNALNMQHWAVDYDYINTLGMQMIKGRNFSPSFSSDSMGLLINETAAKLLGFNDPLGKFVYTFDTKQQPITYHIIGVVKNFNFESLHQNIGPLCMSFDKYTGLTVLKINTSDIQELISQIGSVWKTLSPQLPFSYRFMDDSFNEMYKGEESVSRIAVSFAVLAIFIACLGLFGLVTYTVQQRTKEIGVRKVLGATVANIVGMLSKDFLRLVLIASVIAFPVAWWMMSRWLQDFAFRINIGWWVFAASGLSALLIAFLPVGWQSAKAAFRNPVKSLRSE